MSALPVKPERCAGLDLKQKRYQLTGTEMTAMTAKILRRPGDKQPILPVMMRGTN